MLFYHSTVVASFSKDHLHSSLPWYYGSWWIYHLVLWLNGLIKKDIYYRMNWGGSYYFDKCTSIFWLLYVLFYASKTIFQKDVHRFHKMAKGIFDTQIKLLWKQNSLRFISVYPAITRWGNTNKILAWVNVQAHKLVGKNRVQTQISWTLIYSNPLMELVQEPELQRQTWVDSNLTHHLMAQWPKGIYLTSQSPFPCS